MVRVKAIRSQKLKIRIVWNSRKGRKHLCLSLMCCGARQRGLNLSLKRKQKHRERFHVWVYYGGLSWTLQNKSLLSYPRRWGFSVGVLNEEESTASQHQLKSLASSHLEGCSAQHTVLHPSSSSNGLPLVTQVPLLLLPDQVCTNDSFLPLLSAQPHASCLLTASAPWCLLTGVSHGFSGSLKC